MIPTPVTVHLILLATLTLFMVTFMAGNGFCLSPLVPGVDGYDENGYDVDIPGKFIVMINATFCSNGNGKNLLYYR